MYGPMSGFELSSDGTTCTVTGPIGPPGTLDNCDCSENFNFVDEGRFLKYPKFKFIRYFIIFKDYRGATLNVQSRVNHT